MQRNTEINGKDSFSPHSLSTTVLFLFERDMAKVLFALNPKMSTWAGYVLGWTHTGRQRRQKKNVCKNS